MKAGMWMGFPMTGGGFGAAILIEKPGPQHRFFSDAVVMAMRRKYDRWPTLKDVLPLNPQDGAIVTQTSMICVRDGRWRVLGEHPAFEPEAWVWPLPWWPMPKQRRGGVITVMVDKLNAVELKIDPAILALDHRAGERCRGCSSSSAIEKDVPMIMHGTHYALSDACDFAQGIVTPERLKAWRAINAAIKRALASRRGAQ
jgi:hypothetical protein